MADKGGYAAAGLQQLVFQEANSAVELEDLGVFASGLQAELIGFGASGHGFLSVISSVL
jgi:hypothetical protein